MNIVFKGRSSLPHSQVNPIQAQWKNMPMATLMQNKYESNVVLHGCFMLSQSY